MAALSARHRPGYTRLVASWARGLGLLLLAFQAGPVCSAPVSLGIADLSYGQALFSYHRQDYFDALSQLLIARQRGGGHGHGDHTLLLQGASSLAYRMHGQAGDVFQALAESKGPSSPRNAICLHRCRSSWVGVPQEILNAGWFYLAKAHYRRSDWAGAAGFLQRINGPLDSRLRQERVSIAVMLSLQLQTVEQAQSLMERSEDAGPWGPYILYNLGLGHSNQGNTSASLAFLDTLATQSVSTDEQATLRDKAFTTAGFELLRQGRADEAAGYFQRVRSGSPLVNPALLGYGLAKAGQNKYEEALKPWLQLSLQPAYELTVQESLLAVPYALEKLDRQAEALSSLSRADTVFTGGLADLAAFTERVERLDLLRELRFEQPTKVAALSPYLLTTLMEEPFAHHLQTLIDLRELRALLEHWRANLGRYRELANGDSTAGTESRESAQGLSPRRRFDLVSAQHSGALNAPLDLAPLDRALRYPDRRLAMRHNAYLQTTDRPERLERLAYLERRLEQEWKVLEHSEQRVVGILKSALRSELESQRTRLQQFQRQARLTRVRLYEEARF